MLKCSSDRCVCAPQSLSAGTSTTPRLSVSCRILLIVISPYFWSEIPLFILIRELPCPRLRQRSHTIEKAVHGETKVDRSGARCRPRHRHLGAFYLCHSIGRDVCTRLGFPVQSCRSRLHRGDTSNPQSLHRCCDSPRCRHSALPRQYNLCS